MKYVKASNASTNPDTGNVQIIMDIDEGDIGEVSNFLKSRNNQNLYGILNSGIYFDQRFLGWTETDKEYNPEGKIHRLPLQDVWKSLKEKFLTIFLNH